MGGDFHENEYLAGYYWLMLNLQPIYDLAEICHQAGVRHAVLSPGSRCAPLVIGFSRHPSIESRTISDERSAAFIALGIAQAVEKPVVLICTSGSAAYNYAPAVAEAFFRNIPLVLLTADRPPEWIGQQDGQTIWQNGLYGRHVHYNAQSMADLSHPDAVWHLRRIMNEALNTTSEYPGPVHINLPFREPFYPQEDEQDIYFESSNQFIPSFKGSDTRLQDLEYLEKSWNNQAKKLIVAGQTDISAELAGLLRKMIVDFHIPVVGDIVSNVHKVEGSIKHTDLFAGNIDAEQIKPDLLITFGGSVLSKNLKNYFRNHKPAIHWHLQKSGETADTFQSITGILRISPSAFFEGMLQKALSNEFFSQKQQNYLRVWQRESDKTGSLIEAYFKDGDHFGEFEVVYEALKRLPDGCNLHLANSMAVRYANFCGIEFEKRNITVYGNRGACGIDGCTSTAVGTAMADPSKLNILITGDLAFFYDRNAFWHNYSMNNLRVIILNNHGGGIFRMIKGPSSLPELEPFFETRQALNAKNLCDEFGFEYMNCDKRSKLNHYLEDLFRLEKNVKILEAESTSERNAEILSNFKHLI